MPSKACRPPHPPPQKKEQQKADLADSAQFKGFDKVVVAELHFDDDEVKKSGFDLPYDAEKTVLTREEWDGALADINGVFHHTGCMALLCCLCGDPEDHVGDVKKKCKRSPRSTSLGASRSTACTRRTSRARWRTCSECRALRGARVF